MEKSEPGSEGRDRRLPQTCLPVLGIGGVSFNIQMSSVSMFHFNDKLGLRFDLLQYLKEGVEKPGDSSVSKEPCKHEDMCSVARAHVRASSCGVCM